MYNLQLIIMHYALRIMNYELRIMNYELRIMHYALCITHYALRIISQLRRKNNTFFEYTKICQSKNYIYLCSRKV